MSVPGVIILLKGLQLRRHGVLGAEAPVRHHLLPDPHEPLSALAYNISPLVSAYS